MDGVQRCGQINHKASPPIPRPQCQPLQHGQGRRQIRRRSGVGVHRATGNPRAGHVDHSSPREYPRRDRYSLYCHANLSLSSLSCGLHHRSRDRPHPVQPLSALRGCSTGGSGVEEHPGIWRMCSRISSPEHQRVDRIMQRLVAATQQRHPFSC